MDGSESAMDPNPLLMGRSYPCLYLGHFLTPMGLNHSKHPTAIGFLGVFFKHNLGGWNCNFLGVFAEIHQLSAKLKRHLFGHQNPPESAAPSNCFPEACVCVSLCLWWCHRCHSNYQLVDRFTFSLLRDQVSSGRDSSPSEKVPALLPREESSWGQDNVPASSFKPWWGHC